MAAADPRLSPLAETPNSIDFVLLRSFMEDHFRSLPDGCQLLFPNVNSSDVCPFICEHKICPSLFTDYECPALYHPEFILRYDQIIWLPRSWICRAFQRSILADRSGSMACPIPNCHYAHAGYWSTSEQLTFRALALRTHPQNLGLLYHYEKHAQLHQHAHSHHVTRQLYLHVQPHLPGQDLKITTLHILG